MQRARAPREHHEGEWEWRKSTWHMASGTRIEALGTLPWEIRGAAPASVLMQGHGQTLRDYGRGVEVLIQPTW